MQINGEGPKWGFRAEKEKPYVAVGSFVNVIPIIEEIKNNLPNVKVFEPASEKYIANQKRNERSIYKFENGAKPASRSDLIIHDGFKELKCEPKKQGVKQSTAAQRFDLSMEHIDLKQAA